MTSNNKNQLGHTRMYFTVQVKKKYTQLYLSHQIGGIRTMDIHKRCKTFENQFV
jgi:hypothetical protein